MQENYSRNTSPNPLIETAIQTLIQQRKAATPNDRKIALEARKSLRAFTAHVNPRFQFYRHCEILIDVLERVLSGEIKRLIIQMPPRHGKSELVSRIFPPYYLARNPSHFVGLASYSYGLASTLSRAARDNYERAGLIVSSDAGAIGHWETQAGGGLWAAGAGGSITGKGFHLGIIDDIVKDSEEALSQNVRDKTWEWFSSVFSTRAEPDAAMIVMGTRWHEDDLIGRLLTAETHTTASEHWHIVSMAALYDAEALEGFPASCTLEPDFRTKDGEALCPERFSAKTLKHKRSQMGGYHFEALYQQRPTAPKGQLFDVTQIGIIDAAPAEVVGRVRAWDRASTEGGGDYTAGVRMSRTRDGLFIIESVHRGQWGTAKRDRMIRYAAEIDGRDCRVLGEQEPGSGGKDASHAFVKLLSGFTVRTHKTSGSKEIRADPFSAQVNAGNVRIVRGAWNAEFLEELRQFPRGKHDDQVDAAAMAFNELNRRSLIETEIFRF